MKRILSLAVQMLLAAVIVAYVADWALLRIRIARGRAYDTVQVDEYLSTALKGNKAEYDYMGSQRVTCVRTAFPHDATPCWWLRRHPARWE